MLSYEQVRDRRAVVETFDVAQLEIVSAARQSGQLARLRSDPGFLLKHVDREAEASRKTAIQATSRLTELQMLDSFRERAKPVIGFSGGASAAGQPATAGQPAAAEQSATAGQPAPAEQSAQL